MQPTRNLAPPPLKISSWTNIRHRPFFRSSTPVFKFANPCIRRTDFTDSATFISDCLTFIVIVCSSFFFCFDNERQIKLAFHLLLAYAVLYQGRLGFKTFISKSRSTLWTKSRGVREPSLKNFKPVRTDANDDKRLGGSARDCQM